MPTTYFCFHLSPCKRATKKSPKRAHGVEARTQELDRTSSFIWRKVKSLRTHGVYTSKSWLMTVLHCNGVVFSRHYCLYYTLTAEGLQLQPKLSICGLFKHKSGLCLLSMPVCLYAAAILQGRTSTAAPSCVWGGNLAEFLTLAWQHSFSDWSIMPQPDAGVYLEK